MLWSARGSYTRLRFPTYVPLIAFPAILIILILWYRHDPFEPPIYGYASGISNEGTCDQWTGASDVVVVMKTGASEIEAKLPVHFETTFKCAPNVLVFSDLEQEFEGMQIYDPLRHLDLLLDKSDPDLVYYRTLKEYYQTGSDILSLNRTSAWTLDRYKNIPMLRLAYLMRPNAKWFVFMDADTALMWSNLLTWLGQMDPEVPRYIGSSVAGGGNIRFAHGGTGYIVSSAAARMIADESPSESAKSFQITKDDCCGDSALAKVLRLHNVLITPAFPNVNGEAFRTVEFDPAVLCFAPATMHHMSSEDVTRLFLNQARLANSEAIRYADLLRHVIRPQLVELPESEHVNRAVGWDNLSQYSVAKKRVESFNGCRIQCRKDPACLQFSFQQEGHCMLSRSVLLGKPTTERIDSGWLMDRIDKMYEEHAQCNPRWIIG